MQKPYPECYIVGTGSPETIELAAELGFGYSVVFIPTKVQLKVFDHFRERLAHHGHDPTPEQGHRRACSPTSPRPTPGRGGVQPHVMYFFENNLRTTPRYLNPPGYVTVPEFRKRIQAADVHGTSNWDDLITDQPHRRRHPGEGGRRDRRLDRGSRAATGSTSTSRWATCRNWKVVKNTTLFAEEVIPRLRATKAVTA